MEHIEGETLADRLRKGAVPLDLALRYGVRSRTLVPSLGRSSIRESLDWLDKYLGPIPQ